MRIIWRRAALNDLEAVREFIAQDNPQACGWYDSAHQINPYKSPYKQGCRGKSIAQMGEKAHSALLNCSPNDRR
jgi:hypothetical protein